VKYTRRLNYVERLTARFKDGSDSRIALIPRYAMFDLWRKAPGGSWRREDTYLLRGRSVSVNSDGVRTVTLRGDHANTILEGRVVAPAGETGIAVSGLADAAMKDLVEAWVGTGAPAGSQIDDLVVDGYANVGLQISEDPRRKNLLKLLQDIAASSRVDFYVVHDGDGALRFTADRPWGQDRTVTANKRYGLPFQVFALERGNMERPTLDTYEADLDRVHVAGQGRNEEREVLAVNGASWALTRFNRRDDVVDARDAEAGDTDALRAAGVAALDGSGYRRSLRFDIPADGAGYGEAWDLGDRVSAHFDGETFDYKVAAVAVTLSASGEQIAPTLESL
jgi:hypothetical protein